MTTQAHAYLHSCLLLRPRLLKLRKDANVKELRRSDAAALQENFVLEARQHGRRNDVEAIKEFKGAEFRRGGADNVSSDALVEVGYSGKVPVTAYAKGHVWNLYQHFG
jgi:hypothetical protein